MALKKWGFHIIFTWIQYCSHDYLLQGPARPIGRKRETEGGVTIYTAERGVRTG